MLEILNTAAAIATFTVIAATAIAAVIQLRHMRANNQLVGLLDVLSRVENETSNRWLTEAQRDLPKLMADPQYIRSVVDNTFDRSVAWLQLGNHYERVGSLLKYGLIPEAPFLDVYNERAIQAWEVLLPMTSLKRQRSAAIWENFEYMYVRAKQWLERHKDGNYPAGVPRANVPPFRFPQSAEEQRRVETLR